MSTNIVELSIPNPDRQLFDSAQASLEQARAATITTQEELSLAGEDLMTIKGLQKKLEEKRTSITKPLNDALKSVNDLFRPAKAWLEEAEAIRKGQMTVYREAEAEKIRKAQAELEEIARKEREALAAKAAEAERKAREQADKLRAAANTEAERQAAERRIAQKEAEAAAKAEALRAEAAATVAPKIVVEPPRSFGQSVRESWTFEIVDASLIPREFLVIDEKKIGGIVRVMKHDHGIPGVKAIKGEVISSKAW